jgi:hypothetical protein
MPPNNDTQHACIQQPIIEEMRRRQGVADVSLATLQQTCDQILEQTTRTNGRVSVNETAIAAIKEGILLSKYTWKMVIKDVSIAVIAVGGVVVALINILGG